MLKNYFTEGLSRFDTDLDEVLSRISDHSHFSLHFISAKDRILCIKHGDYLFLFNYSKDTAAQSYRIPARTVKRARLILRSDDEKYAGPTESEKLQLFFPDHKGNLEVLIEPMSFQIIQSI